MQSILIDVTFLCNELKRKRPPHGIPRVILAYLHNYLDTMQILYRIRGRIFIFPKDISKKIADLLLMWNLKSYQQLLGLIMKGIVFSEKIHTNNSYFLLKIDQSGMKYPGYFKKIHELGIKMLVVIHDLFPILNLEYSDPNATKQFELNILLSLNHAKGIICVSKTTADALADYVQRKNIVSPPVITATLAAGLSPSFPKEERPIADPYFVMVSTLVARKNHLLLLNIWRNLVLRLGVKTPKLVIIGKRSSECSSTLAMLDRCLPLRGFVLETEASDKELANYLYHARALLFPTFAEGYGLPLIEALAMKVPVIASNLPIFHEIAGNIPDYLEPIDGKGWMAQIEAYAEEKSPLRQAQLIRLQNFKMPAWPDHFSKVNAFMDALTE